MARVSPVFRVVDVKSVSGARGRLDAEPSAPINRRIVSLPLASRMKGHSTCYTNRSVGPGTVVAQILRYMTGTNEGNV